MPFLADRLSPLPVSLLQIMPGTPEARKSMEYADSGIDMSYFDKLDVEDVTQEEHANVLSAKTTMVDVERMKTCVSLREDIRVKFDQLHDLLIRGPSSALNDVQPIQDLIGELVIDLGDHLPETFASALIDANCLAEKKEEYFRSEERVRLRNM